MVRIVFPTYGLATACADAVGSHVIFSDEEGFVVYLDPTQVQKWEEIKRKVGVVGNERIYRRH